MVRRCIGLLSTALLVGTGLWAKGLDTQASKDDWEEINFDFNSSVLVDGFPSLLRLAELLQTNAGYHVRVEGHTDGIGSDSFNQKLGLERANTVRDFLVKYGARTNQIETISRGKAAPKVPNPNPVYSPTDVIRFMNRRVVLTVTDDQGRTVGAGGAGDAIRAITNTAPP
jgi:outer membrane protein OmpA-like peptidoglycan-associated protein